MALRSIQPFVDNVLDEHAEACEVLCGIIGDHPSEYAKSPGIWTAAFRRLGIDGAYLPFDTPAENLGALVDALRHTPGYAGGNVTVPYKVAVMEHLDEIDLLATQIGAVNTICKANDGRLIGCNTDADGVVGALTQSGPWHPEPVLTSLAGLDVLLVGAGGAGRATAFALASHLGDGSLYIVNRSTDKAVELAESVSKAHAAVEPVAFWDIGRAAAKADLIINASSVGQSGMRHLPGNAVTCLEPYSPLAPVNALNFMANGYEQTADLQRIWFEASLLDISANQTSAAHMVAATKSDAIFYDLIYSPLETTLMRHARLSGRRALNGKGMNIIQAVEAFVNRVMAPTLAARGLQPADAYAQVMDTMHEAW